MAKYQTETVHAGRGDLRDLGVYAPPLDLSSTYPLADLDQGIESLDALVAGEASAPNPVYARLYNPTVARFENAVAKLERAPAAVAFASGMAALTAALIAVRQHNSHVVAVRPLYGTSDHLLSSELLGLEVTWTHADGVGEAIRPDTGLVIIETPANPTLKLVDIRSVVHQAGEVPVLVDSTFATPVLQHPLELGASLVLHSATKFLGGHGDIVGGVVATSEPYARELRQVRIATGALLHPLAAYLLHRGLSTLALRVERAQETAGELAERLRHHPAVTEVRYPGLPGADPRGLLGTQMRGPGSLLAFEVRGGFDAAASVLSATHLITPAVSLGAVTTLMQHPAGLTHRIVDPDALADHAINPGLLRLSVGLEDSGDLWTDLAQALSGLENTAFLAA